MFASDSKRKYIENTHSFLTQEDEELLNKNKKRVAIQFKKHAYLL